MPPEHEGEPLTGAQVALLREWIAAGAHGTRRTSSPKPIRATTGRFDRSSARRCRRCARRNGCGIPIDAFLAQQHEQHGLTPQPEASRLVLLRRLSLDLIGMPPTAEEIAACQKTTIARLV